MGSHGVFEVVRSKHVGLRKTIHNSQYKVDMVIVLSGMRKIIHIYGAPCSCSHQGFCSVVRRGDLFTVNKSPRRMTEQSRRGSSCFSVQFSDNRPR